MMESNATPYSNDSDSDGFYAKLGDKSVDLIHLVNIYLIRISTMKKRSMIRRLYFEAQETNSKPYTNDWFYRGWMWTSDSTFPYFYDQNTTDWLHFENGNSKPTFYEYKTKKWIRIE